MQHAQFRSPKGDLPSPLSKWRHSHMAFGMRQCCLAALLRPLQQGLCPLRLLLLVQGFLQSLLLLM